MKRQEQEELRAHFVDGEEVLQVVVTDEGVIIDAFRGEDHLGTRGMTADEWFTEITPDWTDGPAVRGLLTILEDRGYSRAMQRRALENYGADAAFEDLAQLADRLETAFGNEPIRECDGCGKVDEASGFLDWVNGSCEDCDPSILTDPENLKRLEGHIE